MDIKLEPKNDGQMVADVIVRAADGSIKYQGPLVLTVLKPEQPDGRHA